MTVVSPVKEVVLDEMTDPITVEDESTSNEAIPTTTEDFGQVEPDKVVEDMPLAKVEIVIPAGVIKEDAQEDPTLVKNGKVDISVTTFVPASSLSPLSNVYVDAFFNNSFIFFLSYYILHLLKRLTL